MVSTLPKVKVKVKVKKDKIRQKNYLRWQEAKKTRQLNAMWDPPKGAQWLSQQKWEQIITRINDPDFEHDTMVM